MSAGPAARIVGDFVVPPAPPARHRRDPSRTRLPPHPQGDLGEPAGRSAEGLCARGGGAVNRLRLLVLQIAVGDRLPRWSGTCSRSIRSSARRSRSSSSSRRRSTCSRASCKHFCDRRDLAPSLDHARRDDPRLRHRRGRRHPVRLPVRPARWARRGLRPLHQGRERAAARGAGADLRALVRPRHLVEGGARLHARLLHRLLQRLPGRARGQPRRCSPTRACSA